VTKISEIPPLTMTPAAAARVKELLREETADDRVFEFHGTRLVGDETSLDLLKGAQIDYVDDLMAKSFRVINPNASSTCGCGTSFSL
jgi:iron-sulfur cluster insertion protein